MRYIHSDVDTAERVEIIEDFKNGLFDVLVGVNLLREGLDLPTVSLVAILDADKEGFLRTARALTQTDAPFNYNDSGEDLWQYECYVTMADATVTKTTLTIRHPLRGGQLKVLRGHIDDQGVIRLYDTTVGVDVDLKWQSGGTYNPITSLRARWRPTATSWRRNSLPRG